MIQNTLMCTRQQFKRKKIGCFRKYHRLFSRMVLDDGSKPGCDIFKAVMEYKIRIFCINLL